MKRKILISAILITLVSGVIVYLYSNNSLNSMKNENKKEYIVNGLYAPVTLPDLIIGSDLIVEGVVVSIDKSKNVIDGEINEKIVTDVNVKINKVYLGTPISDKIVVRLKSGDTPAENFINSREATLKKGETTIMFLKNSKNHTNINDTNHYHFTAGKIGNFTKSLIGESWKSENSSFTPTILSELVLKYKNDNEDRKINEKTESTKTKEEKNKKSIDAAIKSGLLRSDLEEFNKNNKDNIGKRIPLEKK